MNTQKNFKVTFYCSIDEDHTLPIHYLVPYLRSKDSTEDIRDKELRDLVDFYQHYIYGLKFKSNELKTLPDDKKFKAESSLHDCGEYGGLFDDEMDIFPELMYGEKMHKFMTKQGYLPEEERGLCGYAEDFLNAMNYLELQQTDQKVYLTSIPSSNPETKNMVEKLIDVLCQFDSRHFEKFAICQENRQETAHQNAEVKRTPGQRIVNWKQKVLNTLESSECSIIILDDVLTSGSSFEDAIAYLSSSRHMQYPWKQKDIYCFTFGKTVNLNSQYDYLCTVSSEEMYIEQHYPLAPLMEQDVLAYYAELEHRRNRNALVDEQVINESSNAVLCIWDFDNTLMDTRKCNGIMWNAKENAYESVNEKINIGKADETLFSLMDDVIENNRNILNIISYYSEHCFIGMVTNRGSRFMNTVAAWYWNRNKDSEKRKLPTNFLRAMREFDRAYEENIQVRKPSAQAVLKEIRRKSASQSQGRRGFKNIVGIGNQYSDMEAYYKAGITPVFAAWYNKGEIPNFPASWNVKIVRNAEELKAMYIEVKKKDCILRRYE